ncbi:alpha/beta fold hydrolase [Conexibacter woesei]|uniref:Alpha/beta hydrolase fold protein n=1 Tax=Conexibacter woesei (strain DSM 14684 / CCUG 47730 / CIP 108061 / JCM 11494 / NBRC 100937 / ID131577) TaxID=469383 RepID=D3F7D6_CONWI|nr:alpha/beta hydrolase [Conexibacter woesei]ADB48907.1 alpha/beta hydrolase fold protein [Conexibacter woesei DSM 14684]
MSAASHRSRTALVEMRGRVVAIGAVAAVTGACAPTAVAAAPFHAEVQHAEVRGERIAWYERGSGPPLLMAIGTGSTMSEWDPALLALLARDRRLIMFDYPGVGRSSSRRGGRTSFAGMADTTARLLRVLGVARADVLGWSMGGFVAQQLAIRHPRSVRRLVLAGTNPGGDRAVLGPPADQRIDSDPDPSDADVLRVLYPRTRAGQAEGRAFLARLERASDRGTIPDDFRVPATTVRRQVAAEHPWLRSNANARALRRLRLPLLVTGGREDTVTPPANARRIARLVPHARLALLPGAHAFLFGERVRFARLVQRFLR